MLKIMKQLCVLGCSLLFGIWNAAYAQDNGVSEDAYVNVKKSAYDDKSGSKHELSDEDEPGDMGSEEDRKSAVVDLTSEYSVALPMSFSYGSEDKPDGESSFSSRGSLGVFPSFSWKLLLRDDFYINLKCGLGISGRVSYDDAGDKKGGAKMNWSAASDFMVKYGLDRRRGGFDVSFSKGHPFPVLHGGLPLCASSWIRQGTHRDDYALRHKLSLEGAYVGKDCPVALALKGGESAVSFALGVRGGYEFALEEGPRAGLLHKDALASDDGAKKFDRLRVGFYSLLRVLHVSCSGTGNSSANDKGRETGMRTIPAVGGLLDVNYTLVKDVLSWQVLGMWLSGCSDCASHFGFPQIDAKKQCGIVGKVGNACEFIFRNCDVLALKSSLRYTLASNFDATFQGGYLHGLFDTAELDEDHKGAFVRSAYYTGIGLSYKFKHIVLGGSYYLGAKESFDKSVCSMHTYGLSLAVR